MAILDSVTVSIADDKKGTFNEILLVKVSEMSVSEGKTLEYCGTNNISSKVNDSLIVPIYPYKQFLKFIKTLKFYNVYKFPLTRFCLIEV